MVREKTDSSSPLTGVVFEGEALHVSDAEQTELRDLQLRVADALTAIGALRPDELERRRRMGVCHIAQVAVSPETTETA